MSMEQAMRESAAATQALAQANSELAKAFADFTRVIRGSAAEVWRGCGNAGQRSTTPAAPPERKTRRQAKTTELLITPEQPGIGQQAAPETQEWKRETPQEPPAPQQPPVPEAGRDTADIAELRRSTGELLLKRVSVMSQDSIRDLLLTVGGASVPRLALVPDERVQAVYDALLAGAA